MTETTRCSPVHSGFFSTLLILGLLGPAPSSLAQQPNEPVQSRSGHPKIQDALERLQDRHRQAEALNPQAAKPGKGPKVRVLQRELLGRFIGDLNFVPSGPRAGHIVMLNGLEVHGIPANAKSEKAIRKLFDLRQIASHPTGIAYVASERLFAIADDAQFPPALLIVDHRGTPQPPRPIQYLGGFMPDWVDGLAYLPPTSAQFPDHLAMVTGKLTDDFLFLSRIQVMRLDGQVVAEIPVPESAGTAFGVAFLPPDRLLVTTVFNEIWTLDFDGNSVAAPVSTELLAAEGIVRLADGRIVTSEGAQLRFYDAAFNRLPQDDRDAGTPTGLVFPLSVAWNSDTHEHLVTAGTEESGFDILSNQVAAAPLSLDARTRVVDLGSSALRRPRATYMPDEHLIAVALRRRVSTPPQIALYDTHGTLVELIDISAIGGSGNPFRIAYIPPTREFVLVEGTQSSRLKILTRSGALAREIDLASIGIDGVSAVAYFNPLHPSGGQFLIFGFTDRAHITDLGGNPISEFDFREELGLTFVAGASAITNDSGRHTVAFTALESADSPRFVVFTLK